MYIWQKTGRMKQKICNHLESLDAENLKKSLNYECEECVKSGDSWVHLRTCQKCGITLCCDSSPNKHASKHFANHGHNIIISAEPNEYWAWCYEDELFIKYK